jgi:hypothetical protein
MRVCLGASAGLLLALGTVAPGLAQSADSLSNSLPAVAPADQQPGPARFDASQDSFTLATADGLGLAESQRKAFFDNVQAVVHDALVINPAGGRPLIDSSIVLVARETGKKMRFIREARLVFADMYARRKGDADRTPGTEDELWRSQRNIAALIELYRKNPDAQDFEMERAMAPVFRAPH